MRVTLIHQEERANALKKVHAYFKAKLEAAAAKNKGFDATKALEEIKKKLQWRQYIWHHKLVNNNPSISFDLTAPIENIAELTPYKLDQNDVIFVLAESVGFREGAYGEIVYDYDTTDANAKKGRHTIYNGTSSLSVGQQTNVFTDRSNRIFLPQAQSTSQIGDHWRFRTSMIVLTGKASNKVRFTPIGTDLTFVEAGQDTRMVYSVYALCLPGGEGIMNFGSSFYDMIH